MGSVGFVGRVGSVGIVGSVGDVGFAGNVGVVGIVGFPHAPHEPYATHDPHATYLAVTMWKPRRLRCQHASFSSEHTGCSLPLLTVAIRSADTPRLTT